MVRVVTDSTADIPADMVAALGIAVVPTYVMFGTETYRDGVDLTMSQFYEKLLVSRAVPMTAAPPPAVYEAVYRRLVNETDEIVSIHLASSLSAVLNSATLAAESVPEARIALIDSGQVTMACGWMAVAAAEAALRGEGLEQIVALVEGMKPRSRVLAAIDTLDYLYQGGRVDWMRAAVGTLLRIKPIIQVRLGEVRLLDRTRSLERSLERLLDHVRGFGPLERAIVLHANAPDLAERVADQLGAIFPDWSRLIAQAGVTVASHVGPGAVGIACVTAE